MKQEKLNEKLKSVIRQAREIGIPVPDNISENVVINPAQERDLAAAAGRQINFR